jgi:hypothetical protein
MAPSYQVVAHEVEALKIAGVQPLVRAGRMLGPEAGLTLVLADDTKRTWLAEKDGSVPSTGDWFVVDSRLQVSYVVPAPQFKALFQEASEAEVIYVRHDA